MSTQNTYWNHNGKLQSLYDEVSELIPVLGECPEDKPALERLREAANLYYDLYNNRLCNYEPEDFKAVFGCPHFMGEEIETILDSIIIDAALENGWELKKKSWRRAFSTIE